MSSGYFFMLMGLLSFAMLGIFHKLADKFDADALNITLFAMGSAALITTFNVFFLAQAPSTRIPTAVFLIAVPFGIFASSGFWFFQRGLRFGNIATSWLLINLSSAVPTVLSTIIYQEPVSWRKVGALILVICSLLLLWWDRYHAQSENSGLETSSAATRAPGEVD